MPYNRISRRGLATLVAASAIAVTLGPSATAHAQTSRTSPDTGSAVINGHAPSLHPEGIAYDPARDAYLVSSLRHGTVSVVRQDGSAQTLVQDPALVSTIGVRVDAARDRLLVANSDPGVSVKTSSATQRRTAGLGIYDLKSGKSIRYVDLAKVAGDGGEHFANDIAVAPDGTAYVTDSFAPIVYRIPVNGPASVFLRDERLDGGDGFGANGIVWRDGRLVIGKYNDGTLWQVPVRKPAALAQVRLDRALPGADGLARRHDGSLVLVTNKLASTGIDGVFSLRISADWSRATVVCERAWPDPAPTAVATGRTGTAHVLSGRLDLLFSGTTADTFTIRRF
jgi:sugar lactone lactonase YvrE